MTVIDRVVRWNLDLDGSDAIYGDERERLRWYEGITTAASLLNLARNIGGSVGISIVSSQLVRMTQVAHADMASNVTAQSLPMAAQRKCLARLPWSRPSALPEPVRVGRLRAVTA